MDKGVLRVLAGWLNTAYADKNYGQLGELLRLLTKLPLGFDDLVEFKFGRVIKKVIREAETTGEQQLAKELATTLFHNWTLLADASEPTPTSHKRPPDAAQEPADTKPQRRVHFPTETCKLVTVHEFHRDPEEWAYLGLPTLILSHDLLHADKDEAAHLFGSEKRAAQDEDDEDERFPPWVPPRPIAHNKLPQPIMNSPEAVHQTEQARKVLAATYFSLADIPANPTDPPPAPEATGAAKTKQLPLWDPATDALLVHKHVDLGPPSPSAAPALVDPAVLSSLFSNPHSLNLTSFLPAPAPSTRPSSKRPLCRDYRPGRPGSCRLGDACPFLHQD